MSKLKETKSNQTTFTPDSVKSIRWDLSEFFKSLSDHKIDELVSKTLTDSEVFAKKHYGKLSGYSTKKLMKAIEEKTDLITSLELSQYVHLEFATDTQSSLAKSRVLQIEEAGAKIQNNLLFFELEQANY